MVGRRVPRRTLHKSRIKGRWRGGNGCDVMVWDEEHECTVSLLIDVLALSGPVNDDFSVELKALRWMYDIKHAA